MSSVTLWGCAMPLQPLEGTDRRSSLLTPERSLAKDGYLLGSAEGLITVLILLSLVISA